MNSCRYEFCWAEQTLDESCAMRAGKYFQISTERTGSKVKKSFVPRPDAAGLAHEAADYAFEDSRRALLSPVRKVITLWLVTGKP
jgi:hypothetical protein